MIEHQNDLLFDILRLFSRIGFFFLAFATYRLWRILTSPEQKTGARRFIRASVAILVISFVLLCGDYYYDNYLTRYTSIIFNVFATYFSATLIYIKAEQIKRRVAPEALDHYHKAMDNMIASMKRKPIG